MNKLLIESAQEVEVLTEQTENGKQLYIEGIFAQANIKNGNGRFYPKALMEVSTDAYIKNFVLKRRALGELNHPDRPMPDPSEGAILTEKLEWSGNDVIGKAKVLNTPKGQIIKGLLEGGFALGVSTRGLGSLKESRNGYKEVTEYMMTAIDAVDNPSAPDAYVNALVESVSWICENGVWKPVREEEHQITEQMFWDKFEQLIKGKK
jgi:hypothetical protein